jgi:hypothetical protein
MFVVPKRIFKRAHDRNKTKRRLREAYRLNKTHFYEILKNNNKKVIFSFIYISKKIASYEEIEKSTTCVEANSGLMFNDSQVNPPLVVLIIVFTFIAYPNVFETILISPGCWVTGAYRHCALMFTVVKHAITNNSPLNKTCLNVFMLKMSSQYRFYLCITILNK